MNYLSALFFLCVCFNKYQLSERPSKLQCLNNTDCYEAEREHKDHLLSCLSCSVWNKTCPQVINLTLFYIFNLLFLKILTGLLLSMVYTPWIRTDQVVGSRQKDIEASQHLQLCVDHGSAVFTSVLVFGAKGSDSIPTIYKLSEK